MNIRQSFTNVGMTRFLELLEEADFEWIVKRLSGNDTGLTGGHQVGIYFPRSFFERAFPQIVTREEYNPRFVIQECYFPDNDISIHSLSAIYYNSKFHPEKGRKKPYDEFRMTRWEGRKTPVQDPESTGSIFVFAFSKIHNFAVAWVASSIEQEDIIEGWLGREVDPGRLIQHPRAEEAPEDPKINLPAEWKVAFPSGKEIFSLVEQILPQDSWKKTLDELLLARRDCEFEIFTYLEKAEILPLLKRGFKTVDEFLKSAHSISNRRKSRTGASLELNLASIFTAENLIFETQAITENRKKPDFLFPSGSAYHSEEYPVKLLQMLAAKTCCKDRWRQVLSEADRIKEKHLFTLQQGISGNQLQEMRDNGLQLVVPQSHQSSFPKEWRERLLSLESFIAFVRARQEEVPDMHQWIN